MRGFVYFIGSADLPEQRVKIGFTTTSPYKRMAALQTGCPFPLDVIAHAVGTSADETALHSRFADFGTIGEWFALEGALQAYVADLASRCTQDQPAPTVWTDLYLESERKA